MIQKDLSGGLRLSSPYAKIYRQLIPIGFLGTCGIWLAIADFESSEWQREAGFLVLFFFATLWRWNRDRQQVEVWLLKDKVRVKGRAGTIDLDLDEISRVRVVGEFKDERHHDQSYAFLLWGETGRRYDRIEIEFEDTTVLGKRVRFRLDRVYSAARRDRDPRFVRWMKAVNRQNSDLDEVELGKGEDDRGAEGSADHPEESHDPIKRMRKLRRKR